LVVGKVVETFTESIPVSSVRATGASTERAQRRFGRSDALLFSTLALHYSLARTELLLCSLRSLGRSSLLCARIARSALFTCSRCCCAPPPPPLHPYPPSQPMLQPLLPTLAQGCILQILAFMDGAHGDKKMQAIFSILVSALSTGVASAGISYDYDADPVMRRNNPKFYGYLPDNGVKRTIMYASTTPTLSHPPPALTRDSIAGTLPWCATAPCSCSCAPSAPPCSS
jgi:hypothetical protein